MTTPDLTELPNGKRYLATFCPDFTCDDCRVGFLMYMVSDDVWQTAGLGPKSNVCIPCLSRRLGRELTLADFSDSPVNGPIGYPAKPEKDTTPKKEGSEI